MKKIIFTFIFSFMSIAGNLSALVGASGGSSGPTFSGYTALTYDGSMGYLKGINNKCEINFTGSHACTYDEIIKLGASYPYTSNAWVVDGAYTIQSGSSSFTQIVKSGGGSATGSPGNYPMCSGWNTATSTYYGPYVGVSGVVGLSTCNSSFSIPCCK